MIALPPIAVLVIFLSLLPALLRWTRLPAWAIPATAVAVVIGWLYAAGLLTLLNEGRWLLMALAPPAGIAGAVLLVRRGDWRSRVPHPGLVFFVIGSVGAWWVTAGDHLHFWDEFSHWGTAVKAMSLTDGLPKKDTALIFKAYPPAATLFDYFFARAAGGVDESGILLAQYVLFLAGASAAFALAERYTWRLLPAPGLIYLASVIFGPHQYGLRTAYVDHLMGALATAALLLGLWGRRSATLLAVAALTFILPLVKDAGLFIGLVAAVSVALVHIIRLVKSGALITARRGRLAWMVRFAVVALVVLAPLAASKSWNLWLNAHGLSRNIDIDASKNQSLLPALLGAPQTEQQAVAVKALVNAFWGRFALVSDWPLAEWIYLLSFALVFAFALQAAKCKQDRINVWMVSWVFLVGLCLYKAGLLSLYSFTLTMYEAANMLSYHRYMGIYMMFVALVGIALLVRPESGEWRGRRTAVLLLVLSLGGLVTIPRGWWRINFSAEVVGTIVRSPAIDKKIDFVKQYSEPSKVFVAWHGRSSNYPYFKVYYSLLPWKPSQCATFAPDATQPEWSNCPLIGGRPESQLGSYDYLLVLGAAEQFWPTINGVIPEASRKANHFFYRLDRSGGELAAIPVEPAAQQQLLADLAGNPPSIRAFGPTEIIAGTPFNVQPDGSSAIWVKAGGLDAGSTFIWNGKALVSAVNLKDSAITAIVPDDLFAKPGQAMIAVKSEGGALSEAMAVSIVPPTAPASK
jgi:hypothetical protein